jgi:hypothetical protein
MLGILTGHRVLQSEQPPFYDAVGYAVKAKNFWDAVDQGTWANPLNLEPTVRPPGTILMSHPLGFSEHAHGFFFRSTFFPVVIVVLGLWFVALPECTTQRARWLLVSLCLAGGALPLFYHFEPNEDLYSPTRFGLVDTFLAAVAGIAACLIVRGVRRLSIRSTLGGIGLSAYCLLIKPVGILIMIVVGMIWLIHVWDGARNTPQGSQRQILHKYFWRSTASFVLIYGMVTVACACSQYFAMANMEFGKRAAEVLRTLSPGVAWWRHVIREIFTSFGWQALFLMVVIGVFSRRLRGHYFQRYVPPSGQDRSLPAGLSAVVALGAGLWFWVVYTGAMQIRYFYPFVFIALGVLFLQAIRVLIRIPERYSKAVAISLLIPYVLIVLVLCIPEPPLALQRVLGVNVTSGSLKQVVGQAQKLVEKARREDRNLTVYRATLGPVTGLFCGVGRYNNVVFPDEPSFRCKTPNDWSRAPVLRLAEIAPSDYLVVESLAEADDWASPGILGEVSAFQTELLWLRTWLNEAGADHGLNIESETSLRLLRVVDKRKFSDALEHLKGTYLWRDVFCELNPPRWIDRETAAALALVNGFKPVHVTFEDRFALQAVAWKRTAGGLKVELVWQSLKQQHLNYTNTLEVFDSEGAVLLRNSYEQDPGRRAVGTEAFWHDVVEISLRNLPGEIVEGIGISIYKDREGYLSVQHGSAEGAMYRYVMQLE